MRLDEIVSENIRLRESLSKVLERNGFDYNLSFEKEGEFERDYSKLEKGHITFILNEYVINAHKAIYGTDQSPYRAPNAEKLKTIPARIRVNLKEESNAYVLSVNDNGDGIPPENKERIFRDRFSTRGTTGMGLSLVRDNAIFKLKGYVDFDSEVGKGSTFKLYLPKNER